MTGKARTKSLRALHWDEGKHPRDDRGRFSRTPGGRWAAKAVHQLEARFGDTGMAEGGGMPQGRLQTGKGGLLDISGMSKAAKAKFPKAEAPGSTSGRFTPDEQAKIEGSVAKFPERSRQAAEGWARALQTGTPEAIRGTWGRLDGRLALDAQEGAGGRFRGYVERLSKEALRRDKEGAPTPGGGEAEPTAKRAFAIKVGDRFMHKGAEVEAVGVPRAGRKAGANVTVVKVKRVSDGKTGPITIEGDTVRLAGPAEPQKFVEVPLGRTPGGGRVDTPRVTRQAEGVTTPQERQQAAIALGTSFSGNPYSKLPTLEALTDDDFKALTPDQQDNVRFLASKIAARQTGEAHDRARALEDRFGAWKGGAISGTSEAIPPQVAGSTALGQVAAKAVPVSAAKPTGRLQTFAQRMAGDMSEADLRAARAASDERAAQAAARQAEYARQAAEAAANDTRTEREKLNDLLREQRTVRDIGMRSGRVDPNREARIKAAENRLAELDTEDRKAKAKEFGKGDKVKTSIGEFEVTGADKEGYLRVLRPDGRKGRVDPKNVESVAKPEAPSAGDPVDDVVAKIKAGGIDRREVSRQLIDMNTAQLLDVAHLTGAYVPPNSTQGGIQNAILDRLAPSSAGEQFAAETRAALAPGGIDVGRGPGGAQLPGTARREAVAGKVQAARAALDAATTRAEADAVMADVKGAALRQLAEEMNVYIGGLTADDARARLVERAVGSRLNSEALRGGVRGAAYLGGVGGPEVGRPTSPAQLIRAAQEQMRQRLDALEGPKDKLARVKIMRQVLAEDAGMHPRVQEHFRQQLAGTLLRELRKPAGTDPRLAREVLPEITKAQFDAMPEADQKAITEEIAAIVRAGATREIRNVGHRLRGEPEEPAPPPSVGTMSPILALNIGRAPDSKLARNVRDQIARAEKRAGIKSGPSAGRAPGGGTPEVPAAPTFTSPQPEVYDKLLATEGPTAVTHKQARQIVEQMEAHGWKMTGGPTPYGVTTWKAPDGRELTAQSLFGEYSAKPTFREAGYNGRELSFKAALAKVVTPEFNESSKPNVYTAFSRLGFGETNDRDHTMRPLESVGRDLQKASGGSYTYGGEISPEAVRKAQEDLRRAADNNRQIANQRAEYNRTFMSGDGEDEQSRLLRQRADQFAAVADELGRMQAQREASLLEVERRKTAPLDIRPGRFEGTAAAGGRAPGGGRLAASVRSFQVEEAHTRLQEIKAASAAGDVSDPRAMARNALDRLTPAELEVVYKRLQAELPPGPFNGAKLPRGKAKAIDHIVELAVGRNADARAIERAGGRSPGGKA